MSSHSTINLLELLIFWFRYDWHQSCCSFWLCTTFSLFIYLWIFGVHICLLHLCYAVRLFMLLNSLKRVYLYEQQVSPCERARKHWSLGTCKFLPLNPWITFFRLIDKGHLCIAEVPSRLIFSLPSHFLFECAMFVLVFFFSLEATH